MIGIERMILESSSFDFRYRHAQPFITKFAKILKCSKELTQRAWDISVDVYKTLSPLKATPHALALAALDLATRFQGRRIVIHYDQFEATREVVLCRFSLRLSSRHQPAIKTVWVRGSNYSRLTPNSYC